MVEILALSHLSHRWHNHSSRGTADDTSPVETWARETSLNSLSSGAVRTCLMAAYVTRWLHVIQLRTVTALTLNRQ